MNMIAAEAALAPNTFQELSVEWLNCKGYKIKKSTFSKYRFLLEKYVLPELGEVKLSSINARLLDCFMLKICEAGNSPLSHSTVQSILYILRSIVKFAIGAGYMQQVHINFEVNSKRQPEEIQVLSGNQEKLLVKELLKTFSPNNLGILLSLYTGARLGEVCALTRDNFDFEAKTMTINKTVQRLNDDTTNTTALVVTQPKSQRSKRIIPLPEFLISILYSYEINRYESDIYILSNKTTPYEPRTLQYAFHRLEEKCGMENLHFHCLRHTFATRCVQSGFDIKTLSEILGHASVSFTMNRYVHSDIEFKRKQMELINKDWKHMTTQIS